MESDTMEKTCTWYQAMQNVIELMETWRTDPDLVIMDVMAARGQVLSAIERGVKP